MANRHNARPREHAWDTDAYDDQPRFERKHHPERPYDEERPLRALRRGRDESRPFKCRKCKAFIGAPLTGGRHRNHCPACLHSLHVDLKRPGDRASECRTLMAPVGTFSRRNGEQSVVHRCLGCGIERHNRTAADDSPLLLLRLPIYEPFAADLDELEVA